MHRLLPENKTAAAILLNSLISAVSLFFYGFGVYLTIRADIGAAPWDVLNLGISKTTGILYGSASITVSLLILVIDIFLREQIGISMFLDAIVVGKAVDFFNWLNLVKTPHSLIARIVLLFAGLFIMGYMQYGYMLAALGCGPRDTLLVGLKRHIRKIPIGVISIAILATATFIGYLLGGPVGIGTLICAFATGPIMQLAFRTVHFDATGIRHQNMLESWKVFTSRTKGQTAG